MKGQGWKQEDQLGVCCKKPMEAIVVWSRAVAGAVVTTRDNWAFWIVQHWGLGGAVREEPRKTSGFIGLSQLTGKVAIPRQEKPLEVGQLSAGCGGAQFVTVKCVMPVRHPPAGVKQAAGWVRAGGREYIWESSVNR